MQQRPTAAELLADISDLLTETIDAVQDPLRHRVRVAANLAGIVERELRLGPAAADAERTRLATLFHQPSDTDVGALRSMLLDRLADPEPIDAQRSAAIYDALLSTVRDDLAISKPGYADWTREET